MSPVQARQPTFVAHEGHTYTHSAAVVKMTLMSWATCTNDARCPPAGNNCTRSSNQHCTRMNRLRSLLKVTLILILGCKGSEVSRGIDGGHSLSIRPHVPQEVGGNDARSEAGVILASEGAPLKQNDDSRSQISSTLLDDVQDPETLLPASAVARVVNRSNISSIQIRGGLPGISGKYLTEDYAPLRLLVIDCQTLDHRFKGFTDCRSVEDLGDRSLSGTYRSVIGDLVSEYLQVGFSKGKYCVTVYSSSTESDAGHFVSREQLIELARIVDANMTKIQ